MVCSMDVATASSADFSCSGRNPGVNEDERQKKRKDPARNNRHQGVGDARRESCDRRQGRRLLVERLNLLA